MFVFIMKHLGPFYRRNLQVLSVSDMCSLNQSSNIATNHVLKLFSVLKY